MKKIYLYILLFILTCFLLPIMFSSKFTITSTIDELVVDNKLYDYGKFSNIKLLNTSTNQVQEVYLDEYLKGVIAAEMPANYEQEALNAQACVARTYILYKMNNSQKAHEGADICDDSTHCQAWISKEDRYAKWDVQNKDELWNKICIAVSTTEGEVITYNGELINAFFHANSGGKTETSANVWGGELPYLQSVETSRRKRLYSI